MLVAEQRRIKKIDINPLLVSTTQILALDARIVLHDPGSRDEKLPRLAIRPYPQQYVSTWKLKDGSPIVIRPIRPEDEPTMVKFHRALSDSSVEFRYFGLVKLEQRIAHQGSAKCRGERGAQGRRSGRLRVGSSRVARRDPGVVRHVALAARR